MEIDPQAVLLNDAIRAVNPNVCDMLSERGKRIFFPKKGILSQAAEASGKDINATIGTALEDDGTPMRLGSLESQVKLPPRQVFSYAPSYGKPEIRKTWKEMMYKKNPSLSGAQISLPVVTSALTHGLSMSGYMFVNDGEEVILPDLYWENYDLLFCNAYGAKFKTFPMFSGEGFNVGGLSDALSQGPVGKKVVLLNFPNNPTGYTCTIDEAQAIRDVLVSAADAGNNVVVLIDDAYFGLVYEDGIFRESIFTLLANAHERILAVKLDGPTKEDYVWGLRVGFITFGTAKSSAELYSSLEAKLAGAIRGNISNASNIGQSMLINAYLSAEYERQKEEKCVTLKQRFDSMKQILASHPEYREAFVPLPFNSGYFMCVRTTADDAEPIRQRLLSEYSSGVIAFGNLIRIAFSSTPLSKLEVLMDNIYKAGKEEG